MGLVDPKRKARVNRARHLELKPSNREEYAMKLNSAQIERTLNQIEAEAIPADHPLMPQLT